MDQPNSAEARRVALHVPRLRKSEGEFVTYTTLIDAQTAPMAELIEVAVNEDNKNIPPDTILFARNVTLLSGAIETAFISVHNEVRPKPGALKETGDALIVGFMQALQSESFEDTNPSDEDRAIEVGNIYAFARWCGLTDEQVLLCYNTAFDSASRDEQWQASLKV